MTMTRRLFSYQVVIGLLAGVVSAGCASPHAREIDPQVDPILKKMCNILDGAAQFRLRVHATMDRQVETGQLAQFHRTSEITVARPDRLCARTESDDGTWSVWYRDKKLTILDRDTNAYATEDVPGRIGEMLDYMADNYDIVMPMADLLVGKTYDSLLADVESGDYLGLHVVGDTKCHHLLFRQENIDWQIWIDAGGRPLPRKMVITYKHEADQPQYVATMDDWDLAPAISKEMFSFTPPADAEQVALSDLVEEK